jgi:hypothetical protein
MKDWEGLNMADSGKYDCMIYRQSRIQPDREEKRERPGGSIPLAGKMAGAAY